MPRKLKEDDIPYEPPQDKKGRPRKYSDEEIEKLGEEIVAVCEEDGVWDWSEFAERHKKVPCWVNWLSNQYPAFSKYFIRAKAIIGRKMLEKGMEGGADRWILSTRVPYMLKEVRKDLREETEWKMRLEAELKRAAEQGGTHEFVNVLLDFMAKQGGDGGKSAK